VVWRIAENVSDENFIVGAIGQLIEWFLETSPAHQGWEKWLVWELWAGVWGGGNDKGWTLQYMINMINKPETGTRRMLNTGCKGTHFKTANSLTAMVVCEWPLFYKLLWGLATSIIFVCCSHLMARKLAQLVVVVAIVRCDMITCCACTQYLVVHCHFYATLIWTKKRGVVDNICCCYTRVVVAVIVTRRSSSSKLAVIFAFEQIGL